MERRRRSVLTAAAVLATVAVIQGWDWPLLGSYRSAGVALMVLGFAGCALSGSSQETSARSPYTVTATILGVLALVFGIWTVIADTQAPLVALTVDIVLLWFVSTLHHVTRSQRGHEPALGAHEAPSA